jgi:sugar phosphate isomerase/epimerase
MTPERRHPRVVPSTTAHKREPVGPTLDLFARLGWLDVDLNLWPFIEEGASVDEATQAFDRNGQRAVIVSGGWCDFFDDRPAIAQTMASVDRQAGLARQLRANCVRLFYGRLPAEAYTPARLMLIRDHLRELAERHGDLTFVFENHGRGASGQPRICAEILDHVDRPNVRMNFDPINAEHAGTAALDALALVRPFVAHVHLKGLAGPDAYCEFGEGLVDLVPVVRALLSSGYDGRFTVEYEGPRDATLRLYVGYRNAHALISDAMPDSMREA